MSKAFVLMTAMPPTKGHLHLIQFASELANRVTVIVATQPGEPYTHERYDAVRQAGAKIGNVDVVHLHRTLPQDPSTPGFWDLWKSLVGERGFLRFPAGPGDLIVTSEPYGAKLAELTGATFMPYDPNRELYYTKATLIREKTINYFHDVLPEFQEHLRSTITVFGAESTGKTTLSKEMSYNLNGHWLFEWARPYLETVGPEITVDKMTAIWKGQLAIQRHADFMYDKPFVIQDTDLYSTIGYWEQPHWQADLGPVPEQLIEDACSTKSDLYVITKSNIPFEKDVIRYGGDRRESPDEYWINIAEKYNLNYVVLAGNTVTDRASWAEKYAKEIAAKKAESIFYDRGGF